ncbi:helix-hairpin-helix domain-containing protein [Eubacterium sp. 1001713B170207_170306_E7]|uniref:helix-hairpin-helix domain-containing protein n=1 Tax=Eubacterium sp. 1001713B170207_170306_E7 TaxID=2787097 RepID=UPI00189B952C
MKSDLQTIPGVGPSMEKQLLELGYSSVASLKGADPEEMYARECRQRGEQLDRCALYVYRLAVYFAENTQYEPEKLKWWNWKD